MRRFTQLLLILLVFAGPFQRAKGFSLVGPSTVWMTQRLGYNLNFHAPPGGQGFNGGGPMNLGEEYRINFPTVTYGYSSTFLNYFGQRGVREIDKAVAILNALPSMDLVNPNNYPLSSQRMNHRASALFLVDLKSVALTAFINHMGLTDPTRWVYTLRNRWTPTATSTNYLVIQRNFDPETWKHSAFINGQLWTYVDIIETQAGESLVVNQPVDPLALSGFLNAPVASGIEGNGLLLPGAFWTGLTRDDIGGLRYIYRHDNYNLENAPSNSFRAGFGAPVAGSSGSPWTIPNFGTNTTGAPVAGGGSTNIVDQALRPGIGSIHFTKLNQESRVGAFPTNTVSYTDRYITNGVEVEQSLLRTQTAPDILFDAADLQQGDTFGNGYQAIVWTTLAWNGTGDGTTTFGPGTVPPGINAAPSLTFTMNSVGPSINNGILNGNAFLSEVNSLGRAFLWGSFDGSTDEPFVYPSGDNTEAIEQQVLGSGSGGSSGGGGGGTTVGIWTPASLILLPVGTGTGTTTGGGTGTGTTP